MAKFKYWCSEGLCILLKASDTRTLKQWNCPPGPWILNSLPMFCAFVYLWMIIKLHYKSILVPFLHFNAWMKVTIKWMHFIDHFFDISQCIEHKRVNKRLYKLFVKSCPKYCDDLQLASNVQTCFYGPQMIIWWILCEWYQIWFISGQFYRYLLLIAPCNVDANLGLSHLAAGI